MVRLGDFFPEADRTQFVDRHVKPGQILYLYCPFTTPPKDKYLLLVCRSDPPLLFMINSEIPIFIQHKTDLRQSQVRLDPHDYEFLDHESWLDCSQVINSFDEREVISQLLADVGRVKGGLTVAAKDQVVSAVKRARTISPADKELITSALVG